MTKTLVKAPFKADHVGSLLRPENLLQARKDYKEGKLRLNNFVKLKIKKLRELLINKLKWDFKQ